MSKPSKIKISILFTILFHETLHLYNNLFLFTEGVFKGPIHPLIYTKQKETKQKYFKVLHITLNMHINFCKNFSNESSFLNHAY